MNQIASTRPGATPAEASTGKPAPCIPQSAAVGEMIEYYEEAGPDYAAWSPQFNMHFGYFAAGMNPFRREPMLARMNREIFQRLDFNGRAGNILDAGCGLGTSARAAALHFPDAHITGVSIVPWQIAEARKRSQADFDPERLRFETQDYTNTSFADKKFDRIYGIESVCHAPGLAKRAFLNEAARLLKPGGRLVVADGFLKQAHRPLPWPLNRITKTICKCWSLETFPGLTEFEQGLKQAGFRDIQIEDLSWRIAPSVLHVPLVTAAFLLKQIRAGVPLTKQRRENLIAPMLAPLLGIARSRFAYCLVTAVRD